MLAYEGYLLEIDLSREKINIQEVDKYLIENYIGGKGLAVKYIYDNFKPGIDAFDERNILVFATGPLTGTSAPCSGRAVLVSKSPLTNTIFDSYCGGYFGFAMRRAGYFLISIRGKASSPCYVYINNRNVEILDAKDIWYKNNFEVHDYLKKIHGKDSQIASIGIAGVNLVRFANVIHDKHRAFGRGGLGAVMGSKNLKAIVIKGNNKIEVKDKQNFRKICREAYQLLKMQTIRLQKYGTPNIVKILNEEKALPTRNFQKSYFEKADRICGEEISKYKIADYSCFSCNIRCGKIIKIDNVITYSLEYETVFSFGPNLEIDDLKTIAIANNLCNDFGLDTISTGVTIATFIEACEKGIIKYNISFGDCNGVLKLIELIAKREGIGNELAEGTKRFSKKYGIDFAMEIKGLELPGYDARGVYGYALAIATSNRGGCHLRAPIYIDELLNKTLNRFEKRNKAKEVIYKQNLNASLDSLILCKFTVRAFDEDIYSKLFKYATGIEMDGEKFLNIGNDIFMLERKFNEREGITKEYDYLPKRFLEEENSLGYKADLEIIDEYYRLRSLKS